MRIQASVNKMRMAGANPRFKAASYIDVELGTPNQVCGTFFCGFFRATRVSQRPKKTLKCVPSPVVFNARGE
jgi:hypothetical protein